MFIKRIDVISHEVRIRLAGKFTYPSITKASEPLNCVDGMHYKDIIISTREGLNHFKSYHSSSLHDTFNGFSVNFVYGLAKEESLELLLFSIWFIPSKKNTLSGN